VDTPGGGLLIRAPIFGAAAAPADSSVQGPSAQGAAQEQLLGELRAVVGLRSLGVMRRRFLTFGVIVLLVSAIVGTLLSMAMTRYAVGSLQDLTGYAEQIASGNLAVSRTQFKQRDEMGRLAVSFQTMAGNLQLMIRQVRDAFQRVEEGKDLLRKHLASTLENTREQEVGGRQLGQQAASIQRAVKEISDLMESLSQLAEEVSSSVLQMIASIDQIAGNTEGLSEAVHTAASTLSQNVAAIREIDSSVETLNRFVEETSAAIHQMEGNIRQIEENAGETRRATELVATEAQAGAKAMEHSNASIQKLQASFEATTSVMHLLGQRSGEVGNILSVIDEVMEQTHLLALNAAIIAAQAGEHGRSFAVVAGEIKELAGKTSVSTREIASLIEAVQRDVQQAVEAVSSQRALVETSVAMSGEATRVFDKIKGAVKPSLQMVQEIARATTEQARGSVSIVRATEQLRDLAHSLRRGTKEQTLGSEQILEAVNRIRSLSEEMRRATGEQSAGSAIIRQAMDRLTAAVGEVMAQIQIQSGASLEVEKVMETFSTTSAANVANIREASGQVEVLAARAEEVARVLSRFHLEGG
jgi:methyl-accepting chemotaxis protein